MAKRGTVVYRRLSASICGCIAFLIIASASAQAQPRCKVLDPELQGHYVGGCKDGFADGYGEASGTAHYEGQFKAGRKDGKGVKTWRDGDRYDGDFVADRKEGQGTYTWGQGSPWAGEKYTGSFHDDQRDGHGVYEWPDGDRYAGLWKNGRIVGKPTPGMFARLQEDRERIAAVSKPGVHVCRKLRVGIATPDWIRGTVASVAGSRIAVRIEDPGQYGETIGNTKLAKGEIVQDAARLWTPCLVPKIN